MNPSSNTLNISSNILSALNIDKTKILSVSKLNNQVHDVLTNHFGIIYVEGEISNLAKPTSGHMYFTLKDNNSQIKCALFKGYRQFVKTNINNGQKVLLKAKLSVYSPRGDYQLIVENIYPTGLGALQQAYIELKNKLNKLGLFDQKYKKTIEQLPKIPKNIYVITSPTGAAIRDILTTLYNKFPSIPIKIIPSLVQGESASNNLIKSVQIADRLANPDTDVIILARGGGSLEDLWAFNNEELAHAIFNTKTAIITGIGHEVDFTIADFVADIRAATPTAAANIAVPDWQDYYNNITNYYNNLSKIFRNIIINLYNNLKFLNHRLKQQHPETKILNQIQQLDELNAKLNNNIKILLFNYKNKLKILEHKLINNSPKNNINIYLNNIKFLKFNLNKNINNILNSNKHNLIYLINKLNSNNPLEILAKGYSVITKNDKIISDQNQVNSGDKITAKLHKGEIECEVL